MIESRKIKTSNLFFSFIFSFANELREDFNKSLQGSNLKEADLKSLTGGARIANIFRERFPFELVKVNSYCEY